MHPRHRRCLRSRRAGEPVHLRRHPRLRPRRIRPVGHGLLELRPARDAYAAAHAPTSALGQATYGFSGRSDQLVAAWEVTKHLLMAPPWRASPSCTTAAPTRTSTAPPTTGARPAASPTPRSSQRSSASWRTPARTPANPLVGRRALAAAEPDRWVRAEHLRHHPRQAGRARHLHQGLRRCRIHRRQRRVRVCWCNLRHLRCLDRPENSQHHDR